MARRPSKRKQPLKEKHQLKERMKLENEVFDRKTLLALEKLIKKGIIETVDYPISTGKEANVFRGTTDTGKFIAIKIYKVETSPFFRKEEYLRGDPRFDNIPNRERAIVEAFAKKEYKNLQICERAEVHAPKPIYVHENVLIMEFLGEEGMPYPTMNMVGANTEEQLDSVLEDIRKMYHAELVHADISEYNIMMADVPYLIDFGQGVILRHPNAEKFLERDVRNILRYFERRGIKKDFEEVMEWVRKYGHILSGRSIPRRLSELPSTVFVASTIASLVFIICFSAFRT
jgi:RIO kinase 1